MDGRRAAWGRHGRVHERPWPGHKWQDEARQIRRIATQDVRGDNFVYATALSVVPSDTSRFLVGSTDGRLLHQSRFPSNVLSPRAFSPFEDMEDAVAGSSWLSRASSGLFSFHPALALVTMAGGRILLYDTDESPAPISEWMQPPTLRQAVWSRTRPTVFSVSEDTVCAWDISIDLVRPVGTMRPARGAGMIVGFCTLRCEAERVGRARTLSRPTTAAMSFCTRSRRHSRSRARERTLLKRRCCADCSNLIELQL